MLGVVERYERPSIRDLGTVSEITAGLDLPALTTVGNVLVLAVVSNPLTDGGPGGRQPDGPSPGDLLPDGGGGGDTGPGGTESPGDPGGVLDDRPRSGGAPDSESSPGGGSGGDGGTLGERASGGGGDPSSGGAAGEGGSLPFTGFQAALIASIGAALTTVGLGIRVAVRRRI